MALSDFEVFSEYTYEAMTEVLDQQIELFNAATGGALVLQAAANQGDYNDTAFYAKIQDLVRRRNVYGDGAVSEKNLEHLLDTAVKVAAGTPPVRLDPSWWTWIQRNPEEAGVVFGRQLAGDTMQDMLNTAVMGAVAAFSGESEIVHDYSGTGTADFSVLLNGAAKFGDRSGDLRTWVTHSKVMFDIWGSSLANDAALFSFGTVNVRSDGFGRPIIMTDSPALVVTGSPNNYHSLGLVGGSLIVQQNNDFDQNISTENGRENIKRTVQAEWTYNLGIKGFAWDKNTGSKSPNDAAIGSSANWDRYSTSEKDLGGVLVTSQ